MQDVYKWADQLYNSSPTFSTGFTELLSTTPYFISAADMQQYEERRITIRKFQETVIHLFRDALCGDGKNEILHWLINTKWLSMYGNGYNLVRQKIF